MCYDSDKEKVLLFGDRALGIVADPNRNLGDTWLWEGQFWTHVQDIGPSARFGHAMAYDTRRDRVVLFGGQEAIAGIPARGDTWELKNRNNLRVAIHYFLYSCTGFNWVQ